jgi:hypothetical protein
VYAEKFTINKNTKIRMNMVEGTNNAQITSGWNDDVINYIIKAGDIIAHGPAVSIAPVSKAASSPPAGSRRCVAKLLAASLQTSTQASMMTRGQRVGGGRAGRVVLSP